MACILKWTQGDVAISDAAQISAVAWSLWLQGVVGFSLTPQVASQLAQSQIALSTARGASATVVQTSPTVVTTTTTSSNAAGGVVQTLQGQGQSSPQAVRVIAAQSVRSRTLCHLTTPTRVTHSSLLLRMFSMRTILIIVAPLQR